MLGTGLITITEVSEQYSGSGSVKGSSKVLPPSKRLQGEERISMNCCSGTGTTTRRQNIRSVVSLAKLLVLR